MPKEMLISQEIYYFTLKMARWNKVAAEIFLIDPITIFTINEHEGI